MKIGIKTAAEARIDANIWAAIEANPILQKAFKIFNSIPFNKEGNILTTYIPDPLNAQLSLELTFPQQIIQIISDMWGYEITTIPALPPPMPSSNPVWWNSATWLQVTQVSCGGMMIGEQKEVILQSDVINNNAIANTLLDTGLEFNVRVNESYHFEAFIPYTAAITTTGSRWVIDGPLATMAYRSEYTLTATTITLNNLSAYNLPLLCNASSLTINNAIIKGSISPTANGTVKIRFASEVANSAITAKAGAILKWMRIL